MSEFAKLSEQYIRERFKADEARRARSKALDDSGWEPYGSFPDEAAEPHKLFHAHSKSAAAIKRKLNIIIRKENQCTK